MGLKNLNVNLRLPGVGGLGGSWYFSCDVVLFFSFIALTTSFLATALKNKV